MTAPLVPLRAPAPPRRDRAPGSAAPAEGAAGAAVAADLARRPRRGAELFFAAAAVVALLLPLLVLALFFGATVVEAMPRLGLRFLTGLPSRHAELAGILPALVGSAAVLVLAAAAAVPVGVGAALWLEEYAPAGRLTRLIELNIQTLAGVPSIIYGLLGLELFVHVLRLGRSLLAGAGTLALLMLPIVIIAAREALRAVPRGLREACWALGAGRWATVRRVVLPMATPGILTGLVLAVARVVGEAAPLITLGAIAYVGFLPSSVRDAFTALPIQIFSWVSRPRPDFHANASAAVVVLLGLMLLLSAGALWVRARLQRRIDW